MEGSGKIVNQEINVLALVKGKERYIFLFDDDPQNRSRLFRTLRRFASSSELSFTWYDAATLGQKIRQSSLAAEVDSDVGADGGIGGDGDDPLLQAWDASQSASFTMRRDPLTPNSNEHAYNDPDDGFESSAEWWD